MCRTIFPRCRWLWVTQPVHDLTIEAPFSDHGAPLPPLNRTPRSIGEAQKTQNSLTLPHSCGLTLISLLVHNYFQYRYINEAPASSYFVLVQLFVANKIRRCNDYKVGSMSGIRDVWLRNLPIACHFGVIYVAHFRSAHLPSACPSFNNCNLSQPKRSFI